MSDYLEKTDEDEEYPAIKLRDYLLILRKRRGLIFLILAAFLVVGVVINFTATPFYTASSQVLLERNKGNRGLDYGYYYWEPEFLDTQSEIIRSVNVGKRVVDNLDLLGKYRHYFYEDNPEASTQVSLIQEVKEKVNGVTSFFRSADELETNSQTEKSLIQLVESDPLTERELLGRRISGNLSVKPVPDTKIVTISYTSKNPAVAQLVANAAVKGYMDEMLEIKLANSSYSLQWMTEKAQQEREKLERSERELQKYMRDNDLVTVEDKLTIYPQRLSEYSTQLTNAESERKELEALLAQIEGAGNDADKLEKVPVFADNTVLKDVREDIYRANQNIKELSKKYGPKHPVMIKARDELNNLQSERQAEIERIVDSTRNTYDLAALKEENIRELLSDTKSEVLNINERYVQYSILKREVDSNRLLYETLQSSIKKESITEQTQSVNIWVIKEADLPVAPSQPNKKKTLLIAAFLGLVGGVGLAFVLEFIDNTVKSERELERRYDRTVLGTVMQMDAKEGNVDTYVLREPLSPVAESYRLIRSGLLLSSAEKPPGTILVTSMNKGEGKTLTALNMARILMQDKRRVLIVDCDLRRPRVNKAFGDLNQENGLSTYLTGNTDKVHIVSVPGEQLDIIDSGPIPPNPSELLSSERMKALLAELNDKYDFVLLDSPPVLSVTDALVLSVIVDGTIIVVKYGKTTYDMLTGGFRKLNDVNANILGFVLNGLKKSDAESYYYSGYSGYYSKYE